MPCVCVSHSVMSNSLRPPWTVAHKTPLSMEFSRQEYWSGSPFPSPGDLPDPGIESRSPSWQADYLSTELPQKPHLSALHTLIHLILFSSVQFSHSVVSDSL